MTLLAFHPPKRKNDTVDVKVGKFGQDHSQLSRFDLGTGVNLAANDLISAAAAAKSRDVELRWLALEAASQAISACTVWYSMSYCR